MAVSRRLEDIHEGEVVTRVQNALLRLGVDPGNSDGIFGPATERAVIEFQTTHGLVADGIVDQRMWVALKFRGPVPQR
ncbi:MAG: peptidoglycan-binding protein [Actinomycetota bacterium]|nr:peptidoglycan-binding protein [Actinomycetota bacterium]